MTGDSRCRRRRVWQTALPGMLLLLGLLCSHPVHAQQPAPDLPAAGRLYLPLVAAGAGDASGSASSESAPDAAAPAALAPVLRKHYLPVVQRGIAAPVRAVQSVPIAGDVIDRPAARNADLNLALRSYTRTNAAPQLVDYGGSTDGDPPQLAFLFAPARRPGFTATYRVYDWNWACGPDGCRGAPIASPPATLLGLGTRVNEPLHVPARRSQIYAGEFVVLVLYADETRITLKYTREDSPVYGYMVHVEGLAVEPWLLLRYRELNASGRRALPALRSGDLIGWTMGAEVKVAVRDTGSFMDPRSRKDWWQGW